MRTRLVIVLVAAILLPGAANAAELDGASLALPWALPFVGILLTIALGPLLFPRLWHHHYGKFAFVWAVLTLAPMAAMRGADTALALFAHAILGDYLGFIALLFALYVVAGGIMLTGTLRGTPLVNAAVLVFGALIASVVGTTGAAMILIRPLLRANAARLHNVHVVVFFIFLVGNIGGALSPLGDPPLFIGFLNGVDFFWPLQHLWQSTVFAAVWVLALFVAIDVWFYLRTAAPRRSAKRLRSANRCASTASSIFSFSRSLSPRSSTPRCGSPGSASRFTARRCHCRIWRAMRS